jgi:hypothetical protein
MLLFTEQQLADASRRLAGEQRSIEVRAIQQQLRRDYGPLLEAVDALSMQSEIEQALTRCDELGLLQAEDRRIFCQWDQVLFPGIRNLPQWPQWVAYSRQGMGENDRSVLLQMMMKSPPQWWQRQLEQHLPARAARGLPLPDPNASDVNRPAFRGGSLG